MTQATHCPDCKGCHATWLEELDSWENAMASGQGGACSANKPEYDTTNHRTCRYHFEEAVALEYEDEHHADIHEGESYEDADPSPYAGTYSED